MASYAPPTRDRIPAAIAAVAIPAALLWALVAGLGVRIDTDAASPLDIFTVLPDTPPPPEPAQPKVIAPRRAPDPRPEAAASPPNLRSRATDIVAPTLDLPLPPPQIVTAPAPSVGMDRSTGSAEIAGPGTGAGGVGDGLGSGRGGDGDGGGGGGREEVPPEYRSGRIRDSDYPDALRETTRGGVVGVRYTVRTDGRVTNCRITRSSGEPLLDTTTCRLIVERFRYRPSRDADGRPVEADIVENHEWVNEMTDADFEEPRRVERRRRW